ncbi:MAG: thioredoxin family protein [Anaerolineales bacterium]|nr:thioredoxin family protein [Anaerolineales bacterium]
MKRILLLLIISLLMVNPLAAQDQPVARAAVFWMEGCPHCQEILEQVLPSLAARFGDQLELQLVEVKTVAEVDALYQLAESLGIDRDSVQVPMLVIGRETLVGDEISRQSAELIEQVLALGGADWPDQPGWVAAVPAATEAAYQTNNQNASLTGRATPDPAVHFWLFWDSHCGPCLVLMNEIMPPILEKYDQGQVVVHSRDLEKGSFEIMRALEIQHGLEYGSMPEIFIGDQALLGNDDIQARLPSLIDYYLALGGVALPEVSPQETPTPAAESEQESARPPVHLAYFASLDCQECDLIQFALESLEKQHSSLVVHEYSVVSDALLLAHLCGQAGISVKDCITPAVFVGQHGLAGRSLGASGLTELVNSYLDTGAQNGWETWDKRDEPDLNISTPDQRWRVVIIIFIILALLLGTGVWVGLSNRSKK